MNNQAISDIFRQIATIQEQIDLLISSDALIVKPYGINLPTQTVAPASPADGDIVYADGTSWNPGSGEGFYGYEAGAWVKL